MTSTYWWDAPAGRLSIRRFNRGLWRLWAGESFLGSFETPEAALRALRTTKLGKGWRAPADIDDWHHAEGRLPPDL
jgi:hypothetical protein